MGRNLNPDLLKIFVLVHETGSFLAAAKAASLTPSTIRHRIQVLEDTVGRRVFHRRSGGRKVRLTVDGIALLPIARDLVRRHDSALSQLRGEAPKTPLRIAVTEDHAVFLVPRIISEFRHKYPEVEVNITTGLTSKMRDQVSERFDLVLAVQEAGSGAGEVIGTDELIWVCGGDAPPSERVRLALYPKGCLYRNWAEESLREAGRHHDVALSTFSRSSIENVLFHNDIVSILPVSTVRSPLKRLDQRDGFPRLPAVEVSLIADKGGRDEIQSFAACVRKILAS